MIRYSLLVLFLISVLGAHAQFLTPHFIEGSPQTYTASFVAEWGSDTASVETFTIAGRHLYGRAIHLYPEPHLRHFSYYFNEDGSIRNMDVQFFDLANTSLPLVSQTGLPMRITMHAYPETVDFRVLDQEGEKQFLHHVNSMDFFGGWIPVIGQWQWLINRMEDESTLQDLTFLNYIIGDYEMVLERKARDKVEFRSGITAAITLMLDDDGLISYIDAMGSPWNYTIAKVPVVNLEDFTERFSSKKIVGDPSPHEQFEAKISGCTVAMDYGRPSMRGREIFGNVVPYDKVWRTGAGTPTRITLDCGLEIAGVKIPRGTYNLFTIPSRASWQLIFNSEEGAWGSAYREEYDFARVPMQSSTSPHSREKFSIQIRDLGNQEGLLTMQWDKTIAETRFRIME
ncbi:MAG: DUF2911 domain-containing protein [Saprospiraceae bacterium]|nr:DUF2911 domain-containing protein [Saprospiraceae bacterium]